MKLLALYILLLLLGFAENVQPNKKWKWEKIDCSFPFNVYLLKAQSKDDFWLRSETGDIFHCINGIVINYDTPIPLEFSRLFFSTYGKDEFIISAMDNKWETHFYNFSKGRWKKDSLVFLLPVTGLSQVNQNLIYASCNFGRLLKYENSRWHEIKTPLKSHVQFIEFLSAKEIFLLTNSEGLWLFDGKDFKKILYEKDEDKWDLQSIKIFNKNVYIADSRKKLYRYSDGKLLRDLTVSYEKIFGSSGNIAIYKGVLKTRYNGDLQIEIPSSNHFNSYADFKKDSILFTGNDGTIYLAAPTENNYFTEMSQAYGITSNDYTYSYTAVVADLNNNKLNDIMTVCRNNKSFFSFYYGTSSPPFKSIIQSPSKIEQQFGTASALMDFSNDGYPDFIITSDDTSGTSLALFENDRKGNFLLNKKIPLPSNFVSRAPLNLTPVDIDADGNLDLCITYYYGAQDLPGGELILKNSFLNGLQQIDTSYRALTTGWNVQSLFADFTGSGVNDWFIVNKWRTNKLLINYNGNFIDEANLRMKPVNKTETLGACAADFDLDGDLDIITISDAYFLTLYRNDGKGFFTDATEEFKLNKIQFSNSILSYVNISAGDFNNDGFVDLFVSESKQNFLLINYEGKYFLDKTEEFQITEPGLHYSIADDIDNDGDIDIFSYGMNKYALWINNLNDSSFIKVKPRGFISNRDGWGAKVSVYDAGYLDNPKYLRGYRQIGSDIFGSSQNKGYTAHFGVSPDKNYDIKINFYGGQEIILLNKKAGKLYEAEELSGMAAFFYTFPGASFRILRKDSTQLYIITTLAAFILLFWGTKYGLQKYRWDLKLSLGFAVVTISLFWLILLLTRESENPFMKYLIPLSTAAAGMIIPNLVFLWLSRNQSKLRPKENVKDELFHELLQFSHGTWALSNLNSLQLLFENAPADENDGTYISAVEERQNTFIQMIKPKLELIAGLSSSIGLRNDSVQSMITSLKNIAEKQSYNRDSYKELARSVISIRESIKGIKNIIYHDYSCNPVQVIKDTLSSHEDNLAENKIEVIKRKLYKEDKAALIKNYELADIIDNSIQNSVRALANKEGKELSISVYHLPPKILIDIADNGSGIPDDEWEKIFESGYSREGGTGHGLYNAREALKKYGGRIYVKKSSPLKGTTFSIELNEGVLN